MRVLKYPLLLEGGPQNVIMPVGARIVLVAMQFGVPTLWAVVGEEPPTTRIFEVIGPGHHFDDLAHVGSVLDGSYVWHVFEQTRGEE